MKKFALLVVLFAAVAASAFGDEITFSFILGQSYSVAASVAGLSAGPAMNLAVSDIQTDTEFPLTGQFTAFTGPATAFSVFPHVIVATYSSGGANSVSIVDPQTNQPIVEGALTNNAAFLSRFQNGTGVLLGAFDVTFVSPAVLAMFHLQGQTFLARARCRRPSLMTISTVRRWSANWAAERSRSNRRAPHLSRAHSRFSLWASW